MAQQDLFQPVGIQGALGRTERRDRLISAAVFAAASAFLLLGAVLVFLAASPYTVLLRLALLTSGSANPLSVAQYSALVPRILPGGLFYGAMGATLLLFRRRVARRMAEGARSLGTCVARGRRVVAASVRSESRLHLVSLALITVVGAVLRVWYINEPVRSDEAFTYISFAGRSLFHVLTLYPAPNNHILHSALVWLACRIFGNSLWALRLPALVAGVAAIPLIYVTARRMAGRSTALWAAGMAAVSGPFVLYSVNARGYMLQADAFLIMLYAGLEILEGGTGVFWVAFSAAATAGFWTAPSMLYPYLIAAGWLLWAGGRRILRPLLVSGAATAMVVVALYMPVVIVSGFDALVRNPWVQALSPEQFRAELVMFPGSLVGLLHGGDPVPIAVLISLGVALCLIFSDGSRRHPSRVFLTMLVVLLVVPSAQRVVPYPRVLLPMFMVYYLCSAVGWSIAAERLHGYEGRTIPVLLVLVGVMALHLTRSGYIEASLEFPDSRRIAGYLAGHLGPCDRLISTLSAEAPLEWELKLAGVRYTRYTQKDPGCGRVLVVAAKLDALPRRRQGLLDPSLLTVDGALRDAGLNAAAYASARLIYMAGRGEVFELVPRDAQPGPPLRGHPDQKEPAALPERNAS